jgi:hypothetical protein
MGYSWGRTMMAARRAVSDTERRFPVRIRVGVPPRGLGDRLGQIQTWLDANCGAVGWAMAPRSRSTLTTPPWLPPSPLLPGGAPVIGSRTPTASSISARMSRRRAYRLASIRRLENGIYGPRWSARFAKKERSNSLQGSESTPCSLRGQLSEITIFHVLNIG